MDRKERRPGTSRRAWEKVKRVSRKGLLCGGNSLPEDSSPTTGDGTPQGKENGRRSLHSTLSKMSNASSNRSYYTANDADSTLLESQSSRLDSKTMAELDEYGAEAEEGRASQLGHSSSRRRPDGMRGKAPDLPAVPESEARLHQNGSAHSQVVDEEAYPAGERGEFLKSYDLALLKMLNQLHGSEATCIGDVPVLEVAPWNRRPGYLVSLAF
jgi:hypothetical protein